MDKTIVSNLLKSLLAENLVYAPVKDAENIFVRAITSADEIDWSNEIPQNSFKQIFLPNKEVLNFDAKKQAIGAVRQTIAFGMNILDLQAFTLLEHVFAKDIYYQKRRQNIFVFGFSNGLPDDYRKYKTFHQQYEENVLEHVIFDVFIERQKGGNFLFFSGSAKGQALLEKHALKNYQNIEFAGLVPESGIDPRLNINREAVESGIGHPIWDELAEICLSCGKCSIACPTCYCFNLEDELPGGEPVRVRSATSCFYPQFSAVAGQHKDLDTLKKRLYFWYYHKFVRVPSEFSYYGCVSFMRCFKVCPVGINIAKNLENLKK